MGSDRAAIRGLPGKGTRYRFVARSLPILDYYVNFPTHRINDLQGIVGGPTKCQQIRCTPILGAVYKKRTVCYADLATFPRDSLETPARTRNHTPKWRKEGENPDNRVVYRLIQSTRANKPAAMPTSVTVDRPVKEVRSNVSDRSDEGLVEPVMDAFSEPEPSESSEMPAAAKIELA